MTRALPTRYRILNSLRQASDRTWTLDEVAAAHGIERSVAFEHLELLVKADLVSKQRSSQGRGRPANTYRYVAGVGARPGRHRLLARLLARALEASPRGAMRAHKAGREFGSALVSLEQLGGDYSTSGRTVHALSCMFEATCTSARDVVCNLHAGLIEGVLAGDAAVSPLGPDGLGGCRFQIGQARG